MDEKKLDTICVFAATLAVSTISVSLAWVVFIGGLTPIIATLVVNNIDSR